MACPTCDHTMHGVAEKPRLFWCPRCGTIKYDEVGRLDNIGVPRLVERCREFEDKAHLHANPLWVRLGLKESIRVPEDR